MTWHLFPVLARVELDTKERYKFFGLQRQRACGIGSGPRRGRSTFRQCTHHATRYDLALKRELVTGAEDTAVAKAASKSLQRRGFHPKIECTAILVDGKDSVIKLPNRLFGGLYAHDIMHHLFINSIAYLVDAIMDLLTPSQKRSLDIISEKFAPFRDTFSGDAGKRIRHVTKMSYLSAEQKVTLLFTLTSVIGHEGNILPEGIRTHVLTALSAMQIICFAVRGRRGYTEAEHNFIWEVIGKKFWKSLALVVSWKERLRADDVRKLNEGKPPSKRKRVQEFTPRRPDSDESDTVDTATDDPDAPPHFSKSDKIVPHSFVHFSAQVKLGGTHQFHNVSAVEAKHRGCIQLAGTRVRKYNDTNVTEENMLDFNLDLELWDEIALKVEEAGACHSKHIFKLYFQIIPSNHIFKTHTQNMLSTLCFKTLTQITFSKHLYHRQPLCPWELSRCY